MQTLRYIDDTDELRAFADRVRNNTWLAVDTEFERSRTYYPQLCLLQIADDNEAACIDPLALHDLSPIATLFENPSITKVLHAAGQDMEVFQHCMKVLPAPVFDTQIAATLLGHPNQIGYANLVQAELDVELAKKHTRADWTKRPLSGGELEYAADDVRYLYHLYARITQTLDTRGRRDWLNGEMEALSDSAAHVTSPEESYRRIKGWRRLRPAQKGVLREIGAWRERNAMASDRPRRWIMKDDVALDIARRSPADLASLKRIRDLNEKTLKRHADDLLQAVAVGREHPVKHEDEEDTKLDPRMEPSVDILMGALRQCALEADIAPAVLAKKRDLEQLLCGKRDMPLLQGWRRHAAGERLLALVSGRTRVGVRDGLVEMTNAREPE